MNKAALKIPAKVFLRKYLLPKSRIAGSHSKCLFNFRRNCQTSVNHGFTILHSCKLCCAVTSVVSDPLTPWTVTLWAPLSMGFFRQGYWSGLPCPPPGNLPDLGIKPTSLMSPALAGGFFTVSSTWEALLHSYQHYMKLQLFHVLTYTCLSL